jgi:O-acetyl-ADP-ribose deacetylase (regulator of RNase III)
MDPLDVPEVSQLPELTGNEESPVGFADMVLTSLLRYEAAVLHAEHLQREGAASSVSWIVRPREHGHDGLDIEVGISPSLGSFRSVLARFGHHYMDDQLYNGYALRFLRQRGRVHRCHIYMSNAGQSGFWIRVYSAVYQSFPSMQTTIGKTTLRLVTGDIADQDTDAVVTAAHWRLNKGTGTDGTIHTKGGPAIYEECRRIGGCPIGDAVITTGGNLKARQVIHAVGPVWHGGDEDEPNLLASAYRRSLEVAVKNGLRSISFPSISTGAFGYPIRLAAPVALKAIFDFLRKEQHDLEEVRMVLYTREDEMAYAVYAQALEQLLGIDVNGSVRGAL